MPSSLVLSKEKEEEAACREWVFGKGEFDSEVGGFSRVPLI